MFLEWQQKMSTKMAWSKTSVSNRASSSPFVLLAWIQPACAKAQNKQINKTDIYKSFWTTSVAFKSIFQNKTRLECL